MAKITLDEAVSKLKSGIPVALPTETVYGLACPINNISSVKKVFELKGRPLEDPLIVHASNFDMASSLFENTHPDIKKLGKKFWPGPLTLIYKKAPFVSDLITASLDSVAVRIPQNKFFRKVIDSVGVPLAAPSANIFKKVSPTSADHILKTFPGIDVLDGGETSIGIESTIYDVQNQMILRPGDITHKDIETLLKKKITYSEKLKTPGSEVDHYQAESPIYIFEDEEALQSFAKREKQALIVDLENDPKKAAQSLYKKIRANDKKNHIICFYFSKEWKNEEWFGVKNRLLKASTKWIKDL